MPDPVPGPSISVIIPTYRRAERLPDLIEALERQTLDQGRFEVVIVDDASDDDTKQILANISTPLRLRSLRTTTNGGPAVARNLGWQSTTAPFLAFTDDDCLPAPRWLEAGLRALCREERPGVVQGQTTAPPGVSVWGLTDWYLWRIVTEADAAFEACNVFYRRDALAAVGGFDEDIAWWGEDTVVGWRVLDKGWGRAFADQAVVVHSVERRGWWWFVRNGFCEVNVVRIAAELPDFRRQAFWRPWAYRREDAAFVLAILGLASAVRWLPAASAALPYLWLRRPSVRQPHFLRLCGQIPVVDAARTAGQLRGAVKYHTFVV